MICAFKKTESQDSLNIAKFNVRLLNVMLVLLGGGGGLANSLITLAEYNLSIKNLIDLSGNSKESVHMVVIILIKGLGSELLEFLI